jgi:phospholipid/cholesterol/gamma-HCH transport system substrate-binding protein
MSPYRRNVMVGITVLAGLTFLAWMIIQFGGRVATPFAEDTIKVRFVSERADGVADGSPITFRGIDSGHVGRVWLAEDRKQVYFEGKVKRVPSIPGNVTARIRTSSLLGGGSVISLETTGEPDTGALKPNQLIEARFVGFNEMFPVEDFGDLARELKTTVAQFRESKLIEHFDQQVQNIGRVVDSIHTVISDPKTQEDLKATIADARALAGQARSLAAKLDAAADDLPKLTAQARETLDTAKVQIARVGDNVQSVSKQVGDRLTQIAVLLEQFQSIAGKIDSGQGSAGALVNDNRLYESLVDTSRELNATIKDLKRLVEQWEQEGASIKLR